MFWLFCCFWARDEQLLVVAVKELLKGCSWRFHIRWWDSSKEVKISNLANNCYQILLYTAALEDQPWSLSRHWREIFLNSCFESNHISQQDNLLRTSLSFFFVLWPSAYFIQIILGKETKLQTELQILMIIDPSSYLSHDRYEQKNDQKLPK